MPVHEGVVEHRSRMGDRSIIRIGDTAVDFYLINLGDDYATVRQLQLGDRVRVQGVWSHDPARRPHRCPSCTCEPRLVASSIEVV